MVSMTYPFSDCELDEWEGKGGYVAFGGGGLTLI